MEIYREYVLSVAEKKNYYLYAVAFSAVFGMLFYGSVWAVFIMIALSPFFEDRYAAYLSSKRKDSLLTEFKDALYTISASIAAGRQMPRAIVDAAESSKLFYGEDSIISREFTAIASRYKDRNSSIEDMLEDLSERTGIEEMKLFSKSCRICRKTGGNLEDVCLKSAYMIIEQIDYKKETQAALAEKKMDTVLLVTMPPAVLFFLNLCAYDYVKVLYSGIQGNLIMTAALFLMGTAVFWSSRILRLKI